GAARAGDAAALQHAASDAPHPPRGPAPGAAAPALRNAAAAASVLRPPDAADPALRHAAADPARAADGHAPARSARAADDQAAAACSARAADDPAAAACDAPEPAEGTSVAAGLEFAGQARQSEAR